MGRTIFEMLQAKARGPVEFQISNPLNAKVGTSLTIKHIDYRDLTFNIQRILEYKRNIDGAECTFTDYDLLARPLGKEDVKIKLRLNPRDNPDKAAGLTYNVVMLTLYDELAYDEGLHKVVNDTTKKFQMLEDGVVKEEYYRINDTVGPYKAKLRVADGATEGPTQTEVEYWDYWREIKDEAGQPFNQFFFVEMNTDDGWFQMFRGEEIDSQVVTLL